MYARKRSDVISEDIKLCGYFVIITSERMNAKDALELYKSRDASEKLFCADKSYMGNTAYRVHKQESLDTKMFIGFVALILRSKFYTCLMKIKEQLDKKPNYMTVPTAIKELEKIVMIGKRSIACTIIR